MADQKDRFGDKLRDAGKAQEDRHFAEKDRELIEKMRQTLSDEQKNAIREFAKMRCPKCLEPLQHVHYSGVELEECPKCKGIFLDRGELEQYQQSGSHGWLARFLGR